VRYGKPIDLDGLDARAATQQLMTEIDKLSNDL
jgi:hypothetical protein